MAIIKFLRFLTDHLVTLSVDFLVDFSFAKAHLSSPLTFEVLPLRKYWKIRNEIWLQWSKGPRSGRNRVQMVQVNPRARQIEWEATLERPRQHMQQLFQSRTCRAALSQTQVHCTMFMTCRLERALLVHILRCTTLANTTQGLEAKLYCVALLVKAITYVYYKKASCKVCYNCMSNARWTEKPSTGMQGKTFVCKRLAYFQSFWQGSFWYLPVCQVLLEHSNEIEYI